jgi:hypothetical protein
MCRWDAWLPRTAADTCYYEFFDSAVNGWLIDATGVDIR